MAGIIPIKPLYIHYKNAEKGTLQLIGHAGLDNYFAGRSTGMNTLTGDKIDGLTNRNASFKDRMFYAEHGYYSSPTRAWIA